MRMILNTNLTNLSNAMRLARGVFLTRIVTTQVVCSPEKPVWLGANYGWNVAVCAPRRGNERVAQDRAKRRPG